MLVELVIFEFDRAVGIGGRKPEEHGIAEAKLSGFQDPVVGLINAEKSRTYRTLHGHLDLAV